MKMEMVVASMGESPEKSIERVWKENWFFGDQRADLTIKKANFPENTFVYFGKVELNQWSEHVNLHPIDVSYEQLEALNGNDNFSPDDLDNSSKRNKITKIFYSFMKEAAASSNHNLVRNSNAWSKHWSWIYFFVGEWLLFWNATEILIGILNFRTWNWWESISWTVATRRSMVYHLKFFRF